MRGALRYFAPLALGLGGAAAPMRVQAQDIEATARTRGRALPAGYHERVRQRPDFFELERGWLPRRQAALVANTAISGTLRMVVIPALFADSPDPAASVSPSELQRILFDGPAALGTLREAYAEMSRGQLQLVGTVTPWVRTTVAMGQATGTSMGLGDDAAVGQYVAGAVAAADAGIDFRQFDSDGPDGVPDSGDDDGFVDVVALLELEIDAACGGPAIWPHRARVHNWLGAPHRTDDIGRNGQPILVDDYIVQGAHDCSGVTPLEANVIAHELGHVLGLPDYYDLTLGVGREQRRWVVGCWELMSAGSWGCGSGPKATAIRPTHFSAHVKAQLGWVGPTVVGTVRDAVFTLEPIRTSGVALRVPLAGGTTGEHLLLEYRDQRGFDAHLPSSGVLVYHIEPGRSFVPCPACPRVYGFALLEADANGALVRTELQGGNRGEAGDAFGNDGTGALSNVTTPSLRTNAGLPSTVTIHAIGVDHAAGVARVRLSTDPTPAIVAGRPAGLAPAFVPLRVVLRAAGGALPYSWTLTSPLPAGLTAAPKHDTLVIAGTPVQGGTFALGVTIRDARNVAVTETVSLTVGPVALTAARAAAHFAPNGEAPLTAAEQDALDQAGNRNGRYDVGDLRAFLRLTPGSGASAAARRPPR
jgi:M6 family metalloprotease-like protein